MRRLIHGSWLMAIVAVFLLTGCSSSKHTNVTPPANTSGSVTTTTPSGNGGGSTTVCTIPQNNGGDHDADNNGAPSDGDGCDV
jgi:hypothetical protein